MKTQIPMDSLLCWAFRDGAPPNLGDRARSMFDATFFELGTVIDQQFSGAPTFIDDRHPDAVKIQEAVFALCRGEPKRLNWTSDAVFFLGRWYARLDEREIINQGGLQVYCGPLYDGPSVNPGALVLQHAVNKGHPRWDFQERLVPKQVKKGAMPQWRLVCDNGFGKLEDISPIEIARARHEYDVWFEAVRDLRLPELEEYTPMPPDAPYAPWIGKPAMHPVKRSTHSIIEVINSQIAGSQKSLLPSSGA